MKLYTYLNYGGNCRQAFEFYAEHLGGRITMLSTHGEQPGANNVPADWRNAVLHARIELGETVVMGADIPSAEPMRSAYLTLSLEGEDEAERVYALLAAGAIHRRPHAMHEVEVCYDGDLAPDLDHVAEVTGLTREQVVEAHLSGDFSVFMYGFAPGYAYLAGVPEAIRLPRKEAVPTMPASHPTVVGGSFKSNLRRGVPTIAGIPPDGSRWFLKVQPTRRAITNSGNPTRRQSVVP